jgi:hypothetical protein
MTWPLNKRKKKGIPLNHPVIMLRTKTWNCTQVISFGQIDQGTRSSPPSRRRELIQAARRKLAIFTEPPQINLAAVLPADRLAIGRRAHKYPALVKAELIEFR